MKKSNHFETKAIRSQTPRTAYREHSTPLFLTSSFVFDTQEQAARLFNGEDEGNIYSRFSNPSINELADKLCILEGTEDGIITGTGMASVFASFAAILKKGDHILATRELFGSSYQILTTILPKWGIEYTLVDLAKPEEWEENCRKNTKMFFLETPSNPGLKIGDLSYASKLCKDKGIILSVDNCFSAAYLQSPIDFGADLIIHSATKFFDGQGRVLGGAVLGRKELIEEIRFFCRHTGPSISPFNAWVLSKSLETLALRMDRHCENALFLANKLVEHKHLSAVHYPFLTNHPQYDIAVKQMKKGGPILCLELPGGLPQAVAFCNALQMISRSSNLGDTRTIATHPVTTTHSKLPPEERLKAGITDGLIRISVGLEHPEDVLDDILQAIETSAA